MPRSRSRSPPPRRRQQRSRSRSRQRQQSTRRSRSVDPSKRPERRERRERSPPSRAAHKARKEPEFSWGRKADAEEEKEPELPVEKPNFGLSGALAKDKTTGNVQNGVVMKWSEPPEARVPSRRFRLYVFKSDELAATLHVHRKSGYLIGRDKTVADILTEHESCSKQHAVLQYRLFQKPTEDGLDYEQEVRPYVMDLGSTNGTFLNGKQIDSARYIELKVKDVLKFGESTREYVLVDAS